MNKKELEYMWELNKCCYCIAGFNKDLVDKVLYRNPKSKLIMNPEKLIELSNQSIYKLESFLPQMIITEQLYNHLGIFTVDDRKYHTLGKSFDIELIDNIDAICVIENNVIHLKIF